MKELLQRLAHNGNIELENFQAQVRGGEKRIGEYHLRESVMPFSDRDFVALNGIVNGTDPSGNELDITFHDLAGSEISINRRDKMLNFLCTKYMMGYGIIGYQLYESIKNLIN